MKIFIKLMKTKVLFFVAFFAIAISASAQFNVGVKAGFNASTVSGSDEDGAKPSHRPGFHLGVMAQYMVTENFGFESGLYYTTLGVNVSAEYEGVDIEMKMNPSYLQLPITALYKFKVGEDLSLYPSAGIYLGYGIGGKIKMVDESNGITGTLETNFFGKVAGETYMNRFDAGAVLGLNLQYNKYVIGLGYDYGLLRLNKEKAGSGEKDGFNRNIRVSVGYFF